MNTIQSIYFSNNILTKFIEKFVKSIHWGITDGTPVVTGNAKFFSSLGNLTGSVTEVQAQKATQTLTVASVSADDVILTIGDKTIGFHISGTLSTGTADHTINTTTTSTVEGIADAIESYLEAAGGTVIKKAGAGNNDATVELEAKDAGADGNNLSVQ